MNSAFNYTAFLDLSIGEIIMFASIILIFAAVIFNRYCATENQHIEVMSPEWQTGKEIREELKKLSGYFFVNSAASYNTLARLADEGLVETKKDPKTIYSGDGSDGIAVYIHSFRLTPAGLRRQERILNISAAVRI
jgi:hypothetical protein